MSLRPPECVICLQLLVSNLSVCSCGHVFHSQCIYEVIYNSNKLCPLCRIRLTPSKVISMTFQLTQLQQHPQIKGLSPQQSQNLSRLQQIAQQTQIKNQNLKQTITKMRSQIQNQQQQIQSLQNSNSKHLKKLTKVKKKLTLSEKINKEKEYDILKYKGLFTKAHQQANSSKLQLKRFQSMEKMMKTLQQQDSILSWANKARQKLPVQQLSEQFFLALMANTNALTANKHDMVQLRQQLSKVQKMAKDLQIRNETQRKQVQRLKNILATQPLNLKVKIKQRKLDDQKVDYLTKVRAPESFNKRFKPLSIRK